MKYRVNLGSVMNPKFSVFNTLVDAKKAIRERLKALGRDARVESAVSIIDKNTYGLGYRYNIGAKSYSHGVFPITKVRDEEN